MSSRRKRCLDSFYSNSFSEVALVDNRNLRQWLVSDLHPAYPFLSFTHRADYLRCYFMHHYGGGYSDVKLCSFDWTPYFKMFSQSPPSIYMCGYPERRAKDVASSSHHIRIAYRSLPGMCHFIFRPYTPLTFKWITNVHSLLDCLLERLVKHPGTYHPRAVFGGVHGRDLYPKLRHCRSRYPLQWNTLLGRILHPIAFEHQANLCLSMPSVNTMSDYR